MISARCSRHSARHSPITKSNWTQTQLRAHADAGAVSIPRLSFAAFDGERIAAFTLNGRGNFNGLPTAYDTGTGNPRRSTAGTGLGYGDFRDTRCRYLRRGGRPAVPAGGVAAQHQRPCPFTGIWGSRRSREFNYFMQQGAHGNRRLGAIHPGHCPHSVTTDRCRKIRFRSPPFWDFTPSWQNSPEAIRRSRRGLRRAERFTRRGDTRGLLRLRTRVGRRCARSRSKQAVQAARGSPASLLRESAPAQQGTDSVKAINTDGSAATR